MRTRWMGLVAVGLLLTVGTACTGGEPRDAPAGNASRQPPTVAAAATASAGASTITTLVARVPAGWLGGRCVTSTRAGSPERPTPDLVADSHDDGWYGGAGLWVSLPQWGGSRRDDDTIDHKIGWWRTVEGDLQIVTTRLDGPGSGRASVPQGYGASGFQVSGVNFSAPGCWRVTGILGTTRLPFVVAVWV